MSKKFLPLVTLFSVALNVAFVSIWAAHVLEASRPADITEERQGVWCPLHRELNVTSAQWRQLEPQIHAFHERTDTVREDLAQLRSELIDLLADDDPDKNAIAAKQERIRRAQKQMQEIVTEHLLTQKDILTSEQEERLFHMMHERNAAGRSGRMRGVTGLGMGNGRGEPSP
ncbi:MAG: Spy/CpxP family protein refolding chaperone [Candidatus Hydrogenedentota bacterium]